MNQDDIEIKELVYHVLQKLASQEETSALHEKKAETTEGRREKEIRRVRAAEKIICTEMGQHMKSNQGAYETAAVVATCLNAGWLEAHKEILQAKQDELDVRRKEDIMMDLFNISNAVMRRVSEKNKPLKAGEKGEIADFVSNGFQAGVVLGERVRYAMPVSRMSSNKMLNILADINTIPNFSPSLRKQRNDGR